MRARMALLLVLGVAVPVAAKGKPVLVFGLVQAHCAAPPPAPPVPCAPAFAFTSGTVTVTSQKEPTPTCPKTGMPQDSPAGTVKLRGVTRDGAPYTGTLFLSIEQATSFGADAGNGNCELSGFPPIIGETLVATISCRGGACKGTILPPFCLPASCADTPIVSEFGSLAVYDTNDPATRLPIARPGIAVAPARSDGPG